jgi:hypothetical protein
VKPNNSVVVFPRYLCSDLQDLTLSLLYFDLLVLSTPAGSFPPTPQHVREHWPTLEGLLSKDAGTILNFCLSRWGEALEDAATASRILEPLKEQGILTFAYMTYPAGSSSWNEIDDAFNSRPGLAQACDRAVEVPVASCEFVRHAFLEMLLEAKGSLDDLALYLNKLAKELAWDDILVRSMGLRLNALSSASASGCVLSTSVPALMALSQLGVSDEMSAAEFSRDEIADIIACEIFHTVLQPAIPARPFTRKRAKELASLREKRYDSLCDLREKCFELAVEVDAPLWTDKMVEQVQYLARRRLQKPAAELLHLNSRAAAEYFGTLFEDEKAWLMLAGFIGTTLAAVSGAVPLAVAGTTPIGVLTVMAAKAVSALRWRSQQLKESEVAFVYYAHKAL